ncbi:MFS transporter [Mycolicibacterium vinylchloridicum]|uniref:MFS transporter n=1 Tax=Mycolicibacterium vinylchloridicum TaxID=2736928 RepID=UPI0015CCB155|nr:MFS transporter [Mycolicibacterium vinylchloridicum]
MARRLDESDWRPMHTRIAAALGIGWMLDAFEVQIIGSVIPGIQAEFNLDGRQAVLINIVWFAGIALGALGFGYLADRVGRRKLFVATLILYSLAAVATATAPSYEIFVLFRFITALGVGGEYSAITSAIAEFTPSRSRGRSNGLVMSFWAIGGILASLVSILVISTFGLSWRYTMLFGVLSAVYGVIARRLIPESPRWLAAQGRLDEADRVVTAITGVTSADGYVVAGPPRGTRSALSELWVNHRPKLFFGMALDFSEAAGYYGLFTAMSIFVFSSATGAVPISDSALPYYFLTANVGAFFGGLLVSWALDAVGRRPTVTVSYAAAAASMLGCAAAASTGSKTLVLVAFTVAAFVATCAWVSAYPTFSEIFPTELRATGIGASVAVGRIGAVMGQILLAEVAVVFNLTTVFVVLGLFWLIGAVAGALWWVKGIEARGLSVDVLGVRSAEARSGLLR